MQREIVLKGKTIFYTLRRSKRAKYISATMHATGELVISLPEKLSEKHTDKFLKEKANWILKRAAEAEDDTCVLLPKYTKREEAFYIEYAKLYILRKVQMLNEFYGFQINNVHVKRQRSQWGSCSHKRNLNFNYKLIFLPAHLAEYVIIHELCHLGEMSHKKAFWDLVSKKVKNPKEIDKELRNYYLV